MAMWSTTSSITLADHGQPVASSPGPSRVRREGPGDEARPAGLSGVQGSGVARAIELVGPQLRMCKVLATPTN